MNKKYLIIPLIFAGFLIMVSFFRKEKSEEWAVNSEKKPIQTDSLEANSTAQAPNATRNPASATVASKDPTLPVEEKLNQFLRRFNTVEFHFDRNPVTGQVIGVSQGLFDLTRTKPPLSKEEFIDGIAQSFGIESKAMQRSSQQPGQTDLTEVLTFKQHLGEYEVMDAFVKVHSSKQTGLIYYVNSELYPIPESWKPEFKISSEGAYSNLVAELKDDKVIISINPRPIVYAFDKSNIELVWVVDVRGTDEQSAKNDRRLFYGAESGQIRQEVSLRSH